MRPTFFIAAGAVAVLVAVALLSVNWGPTSREEVASQRQIELQPAGGQGVAPDRLPPLTPSTPAVVSRTEPGFGAKAAETEEQIQARVDQLTEWALSADPAMVTNAAAELGHASSVVRAAALQAITHLGRREAIPLLEHRMEQTADAREKVELAEAIAYLATPTLKEWQARGPKSRPARSASPLSQPR